jgi:hypothetical protein
MRTNWRKFSGRLSGRGDSYPLLKKALTFPLFLVVVLTAAATSAQVNVLTEHNDLGRTGQNLNETILTPQNVNVNQFGKLFFQPTNGPLTAQPLYVANVPIPGKGTHNVVYLATNTVYAYDADNNGGVNATPLWQTVLSTEPPSVGNGTLQSGVIGTPVIDPPSQSDPSGTIYLVGTSGVGSTFQYYLHALDITNGLEKFGGPTLIQASVAGTGSGSSGGVLAFDPASQQQRPGLVLLNGILYLTFGSWGDVGAFHGWLMSYNATTLNQIDAICLSPNGIGAGIWAAGAAPVAEVNNPAKPYGRMFLATGNGGYSATQPYAANTGKQNFSMSVLDIDLTGGKFTIEDLFTPYNQANLSSEDGDLGSGGPVLLPTQTTSGGTSFQPLLQIGKTGVVYILDRNNLGGYNNAAGATSDNVVQEFKTPSAPNEPNGWGAGVWGSETYWNGNIYYGGQTAGSGKSLGVYSFNNGVMSTQPTSQTSYLFFYPGPTPSISANGNTNGILWVAHEYDYATTHPHPQMLQAYDATNLQNLLYSTETNLARDNPGINVEYGIPTVANGKVYVGTGGGVAVYGLLNTVQTVATPSINPPGGAVSTSQTVQITDATPNAQIFYTTDGSTPTVYSTPYTGSITVSSNETINAIASAAGYVQGAVATATFTFSSNTPNPVFSLVAGTYAGTQPLTISDSNSAAVIYYTLDGSTPTTASNVYKSPLSVPVSETVQAIAVAPGLQASSVVSAGYTVTLPYTINFSQGFADAQGPMQFNGSTNLDDVRLQLTNGGADQAGSAFYITPQNIQAFTTDFTFQLSNPVADGITFTLQNNNPAALGADGGGLGYQHISKSVAIKFDLHNDAGEGPNSTGLYINGASPTVPAVDLTPSGINLHSGDAIQAHITYDGTTLNMSLTDILTQAKGSYSWTINIPSIVGGNTAYLGFTGATGQTSSSQKIEAWTYLPGTPVVPNYPVGFDARGLTQNGNSALAGTTLQLTDGKAFQTSSAYYSTPVNIESFTTAFNFQLIDAVADGFTFVIQNSGPSALGGVGDGLGYQTIPLSVAIKFDIHNNDGEGNDSTGFYVNGAEPTVPAINLSGTGIVLSNGDLFHCQITYDGTTLTWIISDMSNATLPSVSNKVTVDLPTILDGNTAYVGFTGSSGGSTAIQRVINWSYTNP